jgi:hypothetical protein
MQLMQNPRKSPDRRAFAHSSLWAALVDLPAAPTGQSHMFLQVTGAFLLQVGGIPGGNGRRRSDRASDAIITIQLYRRSIIGHLE